MPGSVPDFWITSNKAVKEYLWANAKRGRVLVAGRSAGGREILAYEYGEKEVGKQTVSFSSAYAAKQPEQYTQQAKRTKPSLFIYSAIHATEIEGSAGLVNLVNIIEHGTDLRGKEWPVISGLAGKYRLVLMPLAQPDGRERYKLDGLAGEEEATATYYCAGTWQDGTPLKYPDHKAVMPLPLDAIGFLGAYFNDNGVNVQHDDFFGKIQPEGQALIDLVHEERPDCILACHSCQADPGFAGPHMTVSEEARLMTHQVAADVLAHHTARNLRPYRRMNLKAHSYFYLQDILYLASGGLPLLYEFPYGCTNVPFTYDEILDLGLILFERVMKFGEETMFRPRF